MVGFRLVWLQIDLLYCFGQTHPLVHHMMVIFVNKWQLFLFGVYAYFGKFDFISGHFKSFPGIINWLVDLQKTTQFLTIWLPKVAEIATQDSFITLYSVLTAGYDFILVGPNMF